MATQAQLGLTMNARNLELFFRRAASQQLSEIKEISKAICSLVEKIAPSIILFTGANDFDEKTYEGIKSKIQNPKFKINSNSKISNDVVLVDHTKDADDILVGTILYAVSAVALKECIESAKKMSFAEKEALIKKTAEHMELYDTVLREYEAVDFTFDVALSSSCFAQLKRHRMATIIAKPYDIVLGVTVPPAIKEIGMEKQFMDVIGQTEDAYNIIEKDAPLGAPYVLTNAHKRRVIFKCNARELYHVSRLREDAHAQWDIRNISRQMSEEALKAAPLTCMFIGGKDKYASIYEKQFGKPPKLVLSL